MLCSLQCSQKDSVCCLSLIWEPQCNTEASKKVVEDQRESNTKRLSALREWGSFTVEYPALWQLRWWNRWWIVSNNFHRWRQADISKSGESELNTQVMHFKIFIFRAENVFSNHFHYGAFTQNNLLFYLWSNPYWMWYGTFFYLGWLGHHVCFSGGLLKCDILLLHITHLPGWVQSVIFVLLWFCCWDKW